MTTARIRGKVWGMNYRHLREQLTVLAARADVDIRFVGFKRGWFTTTVSFEAEGERASLEAFADAIALEYD